VSFSSVGGLSEQIRELREVIELPLTNPELFKRVGIKPPKVRLTLVVFAGRRVKRPLSSLRAGTCSMARLGKRSPSTSSVSCASDSRPHSRASSSELAKLCCRTLSL